MAILDEPIVYTHTHFQTEEALMSLLEYEDFHVHKALHDELIDHVGDLRAKLESGKASINFELMHFLKQWLTKHILGDDSQLGSYLLSAKKAPRTKRSFFRRIRLAFRFA